MGFTISVYAPEHIGIRWDETIVSPPYEKKVSGAITHKSAGGNCTHRSFMVNPQYHLRILAPSKGARGTGKARTNVSLRTGKDVPVNVTAVWGQGKRVTEWVVLRHLLMRDC